MKKSLAGLTLTVALVGLAQNAQAATLLLQGSVAASCVMNSVSTAAHSNNNLTLPIIAGTASTAVADASVTCNNTAGYKIEATSANGSSRLAHTVQPNLFYTAYELELAGAGSTGFQALATTPKTLKTASVNVPVANELSQINVKVYPIATPAMAGTYEDTVTITLTAL